MTRGKPYNLFWPILFILMLVALYAVRSDAGPTAEAEANAVVGGDSSRSIGIGGADYDIGRGSCVYHVGGLTFAFSVIDEFCQGMELIRSGRVHAGAMHICLQSKVGKNYATTYECMDDFDIEPNEPIETPELKALNKRAAQYDDDEEEREELYVAQQQEIAYVKEELASIKQQPPQIIYKTDPELLAQIEEYKARRGRAKVIAACDNIKCVEKLK